MYTQFMFENAIAVNASLSKRRGKLCTNIFHEKEENRDANICSAQTQVQLN
jgi:hypothetical protein